MKLLPNFNLKLININLNLRTSAYWLLIIQMLWASVYAPVAAQVPYSNQDAGDWRIYNKQRNEKQETFVNLLIILDSSDSMNQPESWRPYSGSYNSHVEYLWNDPFYIQKIGTTNPPAPTSTDSGISVQVRNGYFTYHLSAADQNLADEATQNLNRSTLKNAALADAIGTTQADFGSGLVTGLPKWLYRNYGGPADLAFEHYGTARWFNSSWIYFIPNNLVSPNPVTAHAEFIKSPYFLSTSFSKFLGQNNVYNQVRASIYYQAQADVESLSIVKTPENPPSFNAAAGYDLRANFRGGIDYERFNVCDASRYDSSITRLTGLGVVAYGIKPSTVFAPSYAQTKKPASGGDVRDVFTQPVVGFNTGYYKNINYVRFDPYYSSTMTRADFINRYPGPGDFGSNAPEVWPADHATNFNYYHELANNMNFNPSYLDMRCYISSSINRTTFNLDTNKYFNGTGTSFCPYEWKSSPRRDNFIAFRANSDSSPLFGGQINSDGTGAQQKNWGAHGLPIRVLRYSLVPGSGDITTTPSTRILRTDYGKCPTSSDIGPGGYQDYLCLNSSTNALNMTWTKLRSDLGGFNYAHALYELYTRLNTPKADFSGHDGVKTADNLEIIKRMMGVYGVSPFSTSSTTRFSPQNNGTTATPNTDSTIMFAAYLGNRDCAHFAGNLDHCAGVTRASELTTGVSGYVDYTRSTYNFCQLPDGTWREPTSGLGCWQTSNAAATTFARTSSPPNSINPYFSDDGGSTWTNNTSASVPAGSNFKSGSQPNLSSASWEHFSPGSVGTSREYSFTTGASEKRDILTVLREDNSFTTAVFKVSTTSVNTACSATATASPQYSKDGGATWTSGNETTGFVGETIRLKMGIATPTNARYIWIGDEGIKSDTGATGEVDIPITSAMAGKHLLIRGHYFTDSCLANETDFKLRLGSYIRLPVRSNTYQVQDTQYNTTAILPARNDGVVDSVRADHSDTVYLVAPRHQPAFDSFASFGAVAINKSTASATIDPTFKQYRRYVECEVDRSTMKWVYAENPHGNTQTQMFFTHPTCTRKSLGGGTYSDTSDCQVKIGAGSWGTESNQSLCTGLADPICGFSPINYVDSAARFDFGGCGMFTNSASLEGGAAVAVGGKSCMAHRHNKYYVINWGISGHTDASLATLWNNNKGLFSSGWNTPNPYNSGLASFAPISDLKSGFSKLANLDIRTADSNLCSFSQIPEITTSVTVPGFEPVYFDNSIPTQRKAFNARSGYSCNSSSNNIDELRKILPSPYNTYDTRFLRVGVTVNPNSFGMSPGDTTETEANAFIADPTKNVGGCVANIPYTVNWVAPVPANPTPTEETDRRVFQAYNVLNFGTPIMSRNSSIGPDSSLGNLIPHFVHGCVNKSINGYESVGNPPAHIGEGSSLSFIKSGTLQFDNFKKSKEDIRNFLRADRFAELDTKITEMEPFKSVSSSGSTGSAIDMYSANYLNFVFGPKYQGSPIGRRTRFQLAQDTIAEFVSSTPTRVRVGLMMFSHIASVDGLTHGGYVATAVKKLDDQNCTKISQSFTVASNLITLTPVNGVDTWFERVPNPTTGIPGIPEGAKTNLVTGGIVKFPANGLATYLPIKLSGVSDDGVLTLDSSAPLVYSGATVTVEIENCNLANYTALTGHRAQLVKTLYSKRATSQTPLTETLYEAYLYFAGKNAFSGKYTDTPRALNATPEVDTEAFVDGAIAAGTFQYASPILTIDDDVPGRLPGETYSGCATNSILLITDGEPYGDWKTNNAILSIPKAANNVSTNLSNDSSGILNQVSTVDSVVTSEVSSGGLNAKQFSTPASLPFGPKDSGVNSGFGVDYSLFDELAYFIGNGDVSPAGVNVTQTIKLFSAALDINCSPVIQNAIERNRIGGRCAQVFSSTDGLRDVFENILSQLNDWVPTASFAAVPLPATNRSSSSIETYMGMFQPENSRLWWGNMKKFQIGFGPVECGIDASRNPIDVCITGRNTTRSFSIGNLTYNSRNILIRAKGSDDITIDTYGVDYWAPSGQLTGGHLVNSGGVSEKNTSIDYKTNWHPVYTFLPNGIRTSAIADLTHNSNRVDSDINPDILKANIYGTMVTENGSITAMPSNYDPNILVHFMRGGDPTKPLGNNIVRKYSHGDVMHSSPATISYKNGSSTYTRLFYLTGYGDLLSVKDRASSSSTEDGKIAWRFYPTEALRRQYELVQNISTTGIDAKIFGADGSVSAQVFDNNNDGYINKSDGDAAFIAFGLRRGGRAMYVMDITDPDDPKIHWKLSPEELCRHDATGSFTCSTSASLLSANSLPNNFFSELGYTWSTPLMAFVNKRPPSGTVAKFDNLYKLKRKTPVVIFGGGYDPEADNLNPDPRKFTMGRALYVMDLLLGFPIKFWSRPNVGESINPNLFHGMMIENTSQNYTASTCRADVAPSDQPLFYPIASEVYGLNVDYDAANSIDRLYVGDLGGQLFRFDVGDQGLVTGNSATTTKGDEAWRGALIGEFNGRTTDYEPDLYSAANIVTGSGRYAGESLKKRTRKFLQPPTVATWTRRNASNRNETFNYVYAVTGDIEHPWSKDEQEIAIALVDPEVGLRMRCAPVKVATVGNARDSSSNSNQSIFYLPDVTLEGRIDLGSATAFGTLDNVIDQYDIPTASDLNKPGTLGNVSRENLSLAPIYQYPTARFNGNTPDYTKGLMGWFYRMETGEKVVDGARVINNRFTWTAFASLFAGSVCATGTGTKYYLHPFWATTVDTNNSGVARNCLTSSAYVDAYSTNPLTDLPGTYGTSFPSQAQQAELRLRTPLDQTIGSKNLGEISLSCDSPRPVYNMTYGLLANDIQIAHDGKLYTIGISPTGNQREAAYDSSGIYLGNNFGKSLPSTPITTDANGNALPPLPPGVVYLDNTGRTTINKDSTINAVAGSSNSVEDVTNKANVAGGGHTQTQVPPAQIYWFRDDLQ
jgi:hypothetical protein